MEKKTTKKKKRDTQAREYLFLINNPSEHNVTWENLKDGIMKFKPIYYCISHEEGLKKHTPHYHAFFKCDSPVRFSTLKRRFPACRIEEKKGSASQCRAYVLKIEKWSESEKADTLIKSEEWGEIPKTAIELKQDMYAKLLEDIKANKSVVEIVEENPKLITKINYIDAMRQRILQERYAKEKRNVKITAIFGETNTGKSRSIMDTFPANEICRITDYGRGCYDSYESQDVLVLDEFYSYNFNGGASTFLNMTDIYPYYLISRYYNRVLCATKIYLISNAPWESQWKELRYTTEGLKQLRAINRRIHNILEFKADGTIIAHKLTKEEEILKGKNVVYKEDSEYAEEC